MFFLLGALPHQDSLRYLSGTTDGGSAIWGGARCVTVFFFRGLFYSFPPTPTFYAVASATLAFFHLGANPGPQCDASGWLGLTAGAVGSTLCVCFLLPVLLML